MRNLLYLLLFVLLLPSCQAPELKAVTSKEQPYVRLKDGTTIHTKEVKWSFGRFDKEVNVNGVPFAKKEVSSFCNGYNTFANVHGSKFATMISEGKINVYKPQVKHKLKPHSKYGNYGGPYTSSFKTFSHYYIRNNQHVEYRALQRLTYKNLAPMLPGNSLAYTYLEQYRRQRNVTNITTLAGLGVFIGGALLVNAHTPKASSNQLIGWGMMGTGAALTTISLTIRLPIYYKLYEIVKIYN